MHFLVGLAGQGGDMDRVCRIEVGLEFFPESLDAIEDSACEEDVHERTGADVVNAMDELAGLGNAGGRTAVDDEEVRFDGAEEFGDFIFGDTAAEEEALPTFGFKQIGAHLAAEFLRFGFRTDDDGDFSGCGLGYELGLDLVGEEAVDAGGQVPDQNGDVVFAIEGIDLLHGGEEDVTVDVVGFDAGGDELADGVASHVSVTSQESIDILGQQSIKLHGAPR